MGHCVDQDAVQDAQQLWPVSLEFTPQRRELLLTDTHNTQLLTEDIQPLQHITNLQKDAGFK